MMQEKDQFRIELGSLSLEHRTTPKWHHLVLGIQGNLRMTVRGREWLNQPMFPVVELVIAVTSWLRRGGDFAFNTMEAEESPFLLVKNVAGGCIVEAAWQLFSVEKPLPSHIVREAFTSFASEVVKATEQQLHVDISELVN